jgi:hypothetical protein
MQSRTGQRVSRVTQLRWLRWERLRLSRKVFVHNVQVQHHGLLLDFASGPFGLILKPPASILKLFLIYVRGLGGAHARIHLHSTYDAQPNDGKYLYLYLSSTATQTMLRGTQNFGSVFTVNNVRGLRFVRRIWYVS